jgi:hypothetical protein
MSYVPKCEMLMKEILRSSKQMEKLNVFMD